ncbi:MAG: SDR family oxidoreductase, partial [Cytophagaceae bacterium]|nr:SDR family oxidoreductase [Cytophagaceae bacterium]
MNRKTAIVTGANAGMGRVTALELAKQNYEVVLVCRNRQKGEAALHDIRRKAGHEAVHLVQCDLSSQADIRRAAAEISARFPIIDVLVNNAGAINGSYTETVDGLETTWAVNHLAYFLFTNLLLQNLKAAPAARIVNLSSQAQAGGKLHWDDVNLRRGYNSVKAYMQSKLANLLFTNELARRLKGERVIVNAVHPGAVRSEFGSGGGWMGAAFRVFGVFMRSAEKGAETALWLATSSEVKGITGRYFSDKKQISPQSIANDAEAMQRLWALS